MRRHKNCPIGALLWSGRRESNPRSYFDLKNRSSAAGGETGVPQLMARRLRQPSAGASTVEDLVQTGGRQRLTAPWSFQHHEHPIGRHLRPLLIQIVPKRGEEPRRHRHHPLPTALALGHKYPPLAGARGGIAVGQSMARWRLGISRLDGRLPPRANDVFHGPGDCPRTPRRGGLRSGRRRGTRSWRRAWRSLLGDGLFGVDTHRPCRRRYRQPRAHFERKRCSPKVALTLGSRCDRS